MLDLSDHFENKLKSAIELEYLSVQDKVLELLKYRKMIAEIAMKTNYQAHQDLFLKCNKQLKKLLSL
jgi:hypothetical protein